MFLVPPVTPKHAKMRGDNSPIFPPLTPIPSRWREVPSSSSATSSATGPLGANVASGLHSTLSRRNSGATRAPLAARSVPQSTTAPAAATAGARTGGVPAATSHPDGLEEELLQKYVSTRGLVVVRQSQQVHRRFSKRVLRFLVCLALSDFFAAYVQYWPVLHTPVDVRSSIPAAAASAAERPPIFGPPPPGVYREGFERYPPENVPLTQSSSIYNSSGSSNTLLACAQRVAAVLTYLLRVLAAVWVLKAANAVAPGAEVAAAREDTNQQHKRQQSKGKYHKWIAYIKSLPGVAYIMQKLCVLGVKEGALDGLVDYCCSPDAAKQLLFSLLSAFFLFQVWRMPISDQKPSSPHFAFSRTSSQRAATGSYMLVVGLLGVATLQLLVNALLLVVKDKYMPLLRKLRPPLFSLSSRFSPPSSSSSVAAPTSPRRRPPVQQACLSLFVVAVLLEIFSTIVGVRAVFHIFVQCEPQSQVLTLADTASKGERVLICSAAVAHTLAAFVFASAGTCCSLQNYLISKIFRDGKVNEDEMLDGLRASH